MLAFCANRIMAMQELQASGTMASGFVKTGCYKCPGIKPDCPYYTPLSWVYESEEDIPVSLRVFLPENEDDARGAKV